jgi:pyruvate dehydrogenase kinase 2/3/4
MQTLPYVVVTNPHISEVYELYYKAFESLRRVQEIKTLEDNANFCKKINQTLQEHLTVIPKLAMGVLECGDLMKPEDMDKFMNTLLRSVCTPITPLYICLTTVQLTYFASEFLEELLLNNISL